MLGHEFDTSSVAESLQFWNQVRNEWDDKKSQEIDATHYASIRALVGRLSELAAQTRSKAQRIQQKLDDID